MSITAYGGASWAAARAGDGFRATKAELATAQNQLATGQAATTYAGLGAAAPASLTLRGEVATIDGYAAAVADGTLRIEIVNNGLQEFASLVGAIPTSLSGGTGLVEIGASNAAVSARHGLETMIDILNTSLNGRYLFAGRAADTAPVISAERILNGDGDADGLATLITERKAADAGADGMGRLTLGRTATTVTLGEAAAGLPFGLKVAGAEATGAAMAATRSAGPPAIASIAVTSQPALGDTLGLTVTLPDGSTETITLVAGSDAPPGSTAFAIGADPAGTAANLQAAIGPAVAKLVSTKGASASAMKAATGFFASYAAHPPSRVAGPPFETATALVAGTTANTVTWYRGETAASPRDTATLRISDSRVLGVGATANEEAFRTALAAFSTLAAEEFPATDATAQGRYAALAERIARSVAGGGQTVTGIAADFSTASATLKSAGEVLAVRKNQALDAISAIEEVEPAEAASRLLAIQTRLQASYQTTGTVLKLSLVDYL